MIARWKQERRDTWNRRVGGFIGAVAMIVIIGAGVLSSPIWGWFQHDGPQTRDECDAVVAARFHQDTVTGRADGLQRMMAGVDRCAERFPQSSP